MPRIPAPRHPSRAGALRRPLAAALCVAASIALSLAIALAPVEPPIAPEARAQRPAAIPVAAAEPALTLPGPLPPLRFTPVPPRTVAKAAAARRPTRVPRPDGDVVARWHASGDTLLRLGTGIGRALRAVLQPETPPVVAVAVPAEPDADPPVADPVPGDPPATTEPEPAEPAEPDEDSQDADEDGAAADPDSDDATEDSGDEGADDEESDLRPMRGGRV